MIILVIIINYYDVSLPEYLNRYETQHICCSCRGSILHERNAFFKIKLLMDLMRQSNLMLKSMNYRRPIILIFDIPEINYAEDYSNTMSCLWCR